MDARLNTHKSNTVNINIKFIMQKKIFKLSVADTLRILNVKESCQFKIIGADRECTMGGIKGTFLRLRPMKFSTQQVDYGNSVIVTRLK